MLCTVHAVRTFRRGLLNDLWQCLYVFVRLAPVSAATGGGCHFQPAAVRSDSEPEVEATDAECFPNEAAVPKASLPAGQTSLALDA